jgi:hypothetical protein
MQSQLCKNIYKEKYIMLPTISTECSQFLDDANGKYLVRSLPKKYEGFVKVKVRLKKQKTDFIESFNKAFKNKRSDLHQRAIFTYGDINTLKIEENEEPFFIFPINGYKLIFNPVVNHVQEDYSAYDKLSIEPDIISEQLKMSYRSGTLVEALNAKCEIVVYNIPYYYAVRASLVQNYLNFFYSSVI